MTDALRKCPRCSCATEAATVICGTCGAVLRSIAPADAIIESVICPGCGEANPPDYDSCRKCETPLTQICPRCGDAIDTRATGCRTCGLDRREFFADSARAARRRQERHARNVALGQHAFLAFAAGCLLLALWHQVHDLPSYRNAALVTAAVFAAFWLVIRVIR